MNWLTDFHFLRPYWLSALIIPFFVLWYVHANKKLISSWAEVCDEHLLRFLLIRGEDKQRKRPHILAFFILLTGVLSLAGPTWIKEDIPALHADNPVMIVMNLSSEMSKRDVPPTRIERAKYVIKDILSSLNNAQVGMIVYAKEPYMISPLTEDSEVIDNLLGQITEDIIPEDGDRLDRTIDYAADRMVNSGYKKGEIIVVTSDIGERFDSALDNAAKARNNGYNVNVVKVSPDDNEKLLLLAEKGGGKYLDYRQDMNVLTQKINTAYDKIMQKSENKQVVWLDMGYYLFWIPTFLLLYYFRRGLLLMFVLCLWSNMASASWFLNNNQEAMKYFEKGDYARASQTFSDQRWQGAAAYRQGDYDAAYRSFAKGDTLTDLYNQGNALAKSGNIDGAIKKYEEVLAKDAKFEDARFNLEYLKKQKNQKQQNNNEKSKNQSKQSQSPNSASNQNENNDSAQNRPQNSADDRKAQSQNDKGQSGQDSNSDTNNNSDNSNENNSGEQGKNSAKDNQAPQERENMSNNAEKGNGSSQNNDNKVKDEKNVSAQVSQDGKDEQNAKGVSIGDKDENQDQKEKIRARMQKFRDIPEDKGGLLRAFIEKEHQKQRYRN